MTFSTNQHQGTPNGHDGGGPSSPDRAEYKPDINGDVFHVTQLTNLKAKEKSRRQDPFIPPSDGTPVNNLPNELLSSIFTLGSEAEKSGYDDNAEEEEEVEVEGPRLPFQVLVSHVCRRWREVVIGIPTLWTYLDFAEGPPFDKSRAWLERSKDQPLDIEIDCTIDSDPESESEADDGSEDQADSSSENGLVTPQDRVAMPGGPMPGGPPLAPLGGKGHKLNLILPHSARWRTFELLVDDFHLMYNTLATLSRVLEAPELRALRLCHYDDNENYDHFSPADLKEPFFAPFSGRAPELGLVTLWGVHVDWETCAFLQGLEELELAYHAKDVRPPYEIFTRILRGSPDLHTLTLSASGPAGDPEVDWPANVIELPSVRQLGLAFLEPSYASALLKRLVFPNLLVLSLDFDQDDYSSFIIEQLAKPAPNQRHSLCHNLVDLKLSGMQCSTTAVNRFYDALSNLVSLDINCNHLRSQFFSSLGAMNLVDEPHEFIIPKLTTLTTSGISGERVCHLLTQRPKIKHVRMDSEAEMREEDEAWLRAHTESFDFFDNSDDEDDDIASVGSEEILIVDLTDEEGDGVPGEWVDDNSIE
ncbi:hypothetical protein EDB92DRAFT_1941404 [Lactarius akahatsu]|uniref:F-box domain-containing protein n=1 Tax=Lactarius akahatsu TaxID=416441 RepID=A0AAD4QH00_9AGAM|nr:hypothetical protein EDB92DRAFT_1941404 [Lactarius akahatsu]